MNLCGSNLIPLIITVVCCGAIFYYFNMRMNDLKSTVEKQNRVLTSFITDIKNSCADKEDAGAGTRASAGTRGAGTSGGAGTSAAGTSSADTSAADTSAASTGTGTSAAGTSAAGTSSDMRMSESKIINLASFENLASEEAIKIAKHDKIVVSDDSDTEDSDTEDSDTEDDDSDSETDNIKVFDIYSKPITMNSELMFTLLNDQHTFGAANQHTFGAANQHTFVSGPHTFASGPHTFQHIPQLRSNSSVMEIIDLDEVVDIEHVEVKAEHVAEQVNVEHVDVEHVEVDVEHVEVEHVEVDVEHVEVEHVEVEVEHVEVEHVEAKAEHVEVEQVEVEHLEHVEAKAENLEHVEHDYEHMKVDDLRKIATEKNLATKDEIKRYKKPELLSLLKK
jgi:hypothetical protein